MNRRHVAALVLASLLAACSGSGRLPAAVVVEPPTTTTGPSTPPIECPSDQVLPDGITQASYEPDGPLPAATDLPAGSTMAAIRDSGVLRVGVSADTLLFSSLDPQDNTIKGFDMDMLLEVAKAIFGVNTEAEARSHLAITVIPYRERLPKLKADEVDIVAHTMTINCVRWQQIAFSSEYFHAGQRVLVQVAQDAAPAGVAAIHRLAAPPGHKGVGDQRGVVRPAFAVAAQRAPVALPFGQRMRRRHPAGHCEHGLRRCGGGHGGGRAY